MYSKFMLISVRQNGDIWGGVPFVCILLSNGNYEPDTCMCNIINFFARPYLNPYISPFYDLLPELLRTAIPHLYDR